MVLNGLFLVTLLVYIRVATCTRSFSHNASAADSKSFTKEIVSILSYFVEENNCHLKLLHDLTFVEKVQISAITKDLSRYRPGLILQQINNETGANVAQVIDSPLKKMTLMAVLCSPYNIAKIFRHVQIQKLKGNYVRWLLILESRDQMDDIRKLEKQLSESTQVTILAKVPRGRFSVFFSRVGADGSVHFDNRGRWDLSDATRRRDLIRLVTSGESNLYLDMTGRRLRVAATESWPFLGLGTIFGNGTAINPTGIKSRILKALARALNFTYELIVPEDRKWGNPQPDGSVTGMIGLVARREANFAFTVITDLRATVVDYTLPFFREPLAVFSRASKERNRALAVLSPFTMEVWISVITATLAIGPILYTQSLLISKYSKEGGGWSLESYSFNMFRNLVSQGNLLLTKDWPQRLLFFSWYLFCLVVSALYSGTLTAVLAIPAYEKPIDFLEDLPRAVKEGYTLGVMEDSSNELLFREADSGIYKQTWDLFNHKDRSQSFVNSPATGIERVLSRKFVYIGPTTYTQSLAAKLGSHKFHFGRSSFYQQNIVIICVPGVPYREVFNGLLLRMVEGGLVEKWKDDEIFSTSRKDSVKEESSKISAITLTHLQGAFFIIAVGSLVSTVVLLAENLMNYCEHTSNSTP